LLKLLKRWEIKYPITPNELIDYIYTNNAAYSVYLGSDFVLFSTAPYTGNGGVFPDKKHSVKVYTRNPLSRDEVNEILTKLDIRINDFEDALLNKKSIGELLT
jgi:hypothetical protein